MSDPSPSARLTPASAREVRLTPAEKRQTPRKDGRPRKGNALERLRARISLNLTTRIRKAAHSSVDEAFPEQERQRLIEHFGQMGISSIDFTVDEDGVPMALVTVTPRPATDWEIAFQLNGRMRSRMRKALLGKRLDNAWAEALGYTLADLRSHLEARFADGMSWDNMSHWHIDHVRPLSSFTITGPDCPEFRKAWALENLQPLWARDNLSKGAKWDG